jgi:hypothetical protein
MYRYIFPSLGATEHIAAVYMNSINMTIAPVCSKLVYFLRRREIRSVLARNHEAALKLRKHFI